MQQISQYNLLVCYNNYRFCGIRQSSTQVQTGSIPIWPRSAKINNRLQERGCYLELQ